MTDAFTETYFIETEDDELQLFPMTLKDKDIVTSKIPKLFNDEHWYYNLFNDRTYRNLVDLLYIALAGELSKQQIEEKIDLRMGKAIIRRFKEISQLKDQQGDTEPTEWKSLYASLLQNTSMDMNDILRLTIGQLEDLLAGISANNADSMDHEEKPLEGKDAIDALRSRGLL